MDLPGVAGTAVAVFAGTNVDDLLVLAVLFVSSRTSGRPARWQVWAGQYAGIGVLVGASVLAALGLTLLPDRWVGLLGLVPLALGVRALVAAIRTRRANHRASRAGDGGAGGTGPGGIGPGGEIADDEPPPVAGGLLAVAGITVANGADNIAVYTPLFRTIGAGAATVTIVVFAALVAAWCVAAAWLGSHHRVESAIKRWGRWLVPAVFIILGAVILAEAYL